MVKIAGQNAWNEKQRGENKKRKGGGRGDRGESKDRAGGEIKRKRTKMTDRERQRERETEK